MKFSISLSRLDTTPQYFLQHQAGYSYIESRHTGQGSFVRVFGKGRYPRFHIYIIEEDNKIVFNLHLDQKQTSYEGSTAHSGEYEGEVVEQEAYRLQKLLSSTSQDPRSQRWSNMLRRM